MLEPRLHRGWHSPRPDVGVHGLGEDRGRGLGHSGVGLEAFYLQEEVCTGGTARKAVRARQGLQPCQGECPQLRDTGPCPGTGRLEAEATCPREGGGSAGV